MKYYKRTWILCLMIVSALMGLHFLPRVEVFGIELRRVDLLSDLFPDTPDVSEKEMAEAMKQQRPHPAHRKANDCPKGMVCIDDYSMDERRNMDVFYRRLAELNTRKRPVCIAYFGDSFIEGDIFTADLRDCSRAVSEVPEWDLSIWRRRRPDSVRVCVPIRRM